MFDIGANFGLYSLYFAVNSKITEVYAFEPVYRNFAQLCANIFMNEMDPIIRGHNLALSSTAGQRTIYIYPSSTGMSRFVPMSTEPIQEEEQVQVAVFDDLFSMRGKRAFVKCDTEGHEVEVILGMRNFLSNNGVFLQIEILQPKVCDFLFGLGYRQIGKIGADIYFTNF
jgi:FkbM family methyltransferase